MQQLFLLVILTIAGTGGPSAAFVGTETRAECEMRGKAIRQILAGAKVDIKEFACLPSTTRFERFAHGAPADAPRFFYRVALAGESVSITRVDTPDACTTDSKDERPGARIYCTSSTQRMLGTEDKS